MAKCIEMDADMRELCALLNGCIRKGKPVYRENHHAPYYSRARWQRIV